MPSKIANWAIDAEPTELKTYLQKWKEIMSKRNVIDEGEEEIDENDILIDSG